MKKEDIIRSIDKIEAFDLRTVSIRKLEAELSSLLKGFRIILPKYNSRIYLYRGRICDKPLNISDIIYPPSNLIKCYGRVNDIGQQLFYASNAKNVPFYELSANVGDHIAIGTWKSNAKMGLNHIGYTSECKTALKSDRDLGSEYKHVIDMKNFGEPNNLLQNYVASKFTPRVSKGEEWRYKFSIALGNIFLKGNNINGLMYPTIEMLGNADNIVLKPDYFPKHMEFVSVEYVTITKKEGMRFSWKVIDSATKLDEYSNFIWSGRNLKWTLKKDGEYTFKKEGGNYIVFDHNGNRVDPN